MEKIWISCLWLLCLVPCYGQVTITESGLRYDLEEELRLLDDPSGERSFEKLKDEDPAAAFVPYTALEGALQPGHTYWGFMRLENRLGPTQSQSEWVLQFPLILTDVEVWVIMQDGRYQYGKSGFFTPLNERSFLPTFKVNIVKFSLPPQEEANVFFRVRSDRRGSVPELLPTLQHAETYAQGLTVKKQKQAFYIGIILMMLIYNFVLFFYARDRAGAYIYYSLYLLGIIVFSSYNSGDLADWLLGPIMAGSPGYVQYVKLVTYLTLIAYVAFLQYFLDLGQLLPLWNRIFKIFSLMALPALCVDAWLMYTSNFNYDLADKVTVGYALIFILLSTVFVYPLFKSHDQRGYYIGAGILAMDLGMFITILDRLRTVDFSIFAFKVGSILEVIAFSLGLAYWQRKVERERQQAKFELEKSLLLQEEEKREALRLKELDRQKTKIYTDITHELRTPLTVIRGMTEEIEGNEKSREMILRNSDRMLRLVRKILDLSKLDAGKMPVDWRQVDVIRFLRYLTESFQSYAASRHVQLNWETEVDRLLMDTDEEKLQQIISNLVSNAIKYTQEDGNIWLRTSVWEREPGRLALQITVADDGIGIAAEHLPRIFERFYQVERGATGYDESTGIGLALVRKLVQLLGGTITVESELGEGTAFHVLLPVTQRAERSDWGVFPADIDLPEKSTALDAVRKGLPDSPLVLIVEDNADVVTYLQTVLPETYGLLVARDGLEGIRMALQHIPDLIISDVRMPGKNGFEVCERLKNDERTSHIPIVLLTAKDEQTGKLQGWESGADAYMSKPFQREEFLVVIEKLLESRRRLETHYRRDQEPESGEPELPSAERNFLDRLEQIVIQHMDDEQFSVSDLGLEARLNHNQLYRKVKALTGKTPSLFIRAIRLGRARKLLTTTSMNVSEVAFAVGFKDPSYFSKVFQSEFGTNPSELRS